MKIHLASLVSSAALLLAAAQAGTVLAAGEPLRLLGRTDVPGFEGDFDHFAADVKGNRLFLAGEEKGTLEVFDLKTGKHLRTVTGFEEPHAIHYMPGTNRIIVTDSGDGLTKVLDGRTYAVTGTIELTPGADVLSYDPSTRRVWIVTGGKNAKAKMAHTIVSEVDPATGKRLGDVELDTDFTEGIAAEQKGNRLFINVAGRHSVAVVDKKTREVIATWPIKEGENNSAIGLDEENKRLFVVTRKPFKLVVIDTDTGASVASFEAPKRTNELQFDKANRRIYLAGDDYIGVFQQRSADDYREIARVASDKGAKTAILVPEVNRLYVAVAGRGTVKAGVLQYEVMPVAATQTAHFHRLESAVTLKSAKPDWDYVTLDAARGRLFIGRRGEGVVVYDVRAKKVIRTLDKSDDANAVTLVPEFDRGYSTNGDGTSTVFVISTLKTLDRIKVGEDADSAFYEPVTKQLAFTMGDSRKIAFVDAKTGKGVGELAMQAKKLDGTVADGEGNLLMALRDRNSVVKIDVANRKVTEEWKTAPCEEPTGIAYDAAAKRIFVGCRGAKPVLALMDAGSGKVITTAEIGRGNDGVIFDSETRKIYTSNGVDANLVIYDQVDADTIKLAEATTTRPYARTMALDPKTKKVYLVTAEGTADPAKKINKAVAPFYPNRYFPDTFTVLTFAPK